MRVAMVSFSVQASTVFGFTNSPSVNDILGDQFTGDTLHRHQSAQNFISVNNVSNTHKMSAYCTSLIINNVSFLELFVGCIHNIFVLLLFHTVEAIPK